MIFIPFNTPSLKNSKIKTSKGIFSSKTVKKYLNLLGIQKYSSSKKLVVGYKTKSNKIEELRNDFNLLLENKEFPLLISFHFVRESKRKFDFGNATEIIFDLLTAHDIIPDDNISFVFPSTMSIDGILPTKDNMREYEWYSINKHKPGVYININ